MRDIFILEPLIKISPNDPYVRSYPHLLKIFPHDAGIESGDFVRAAHMVYGWMPTILKLHCLHSDESLDRATNIIRAARTEKQISLMDVSELAKAVNNSVVGASKLLHFAAPDKYPIWDSRIFIYISNGKNPSQNRVNDPNAYFNYIETLKNLVKDARFPRFHESVTKKIGYPITPMRALELMMFCYSKDILTK